MMDIADVESINSRGDDVTSKELNDKSIDSLNADSNIVSHADRSKSKVRTDLNREKLSLIDIKSSITKEAESINIRNLQVQHDGLHCYLCRHTFDFSTLENLLIGQELLTVYADSVIYEPSALQKDGIKPDDIFIKAGQLKKFIEEHLHYPVGDKFLQTNTYSKTYRLGIKIKARNENKRDIYYIKLKESLEHVRDGLADGSEYSSTKNKKTRKRTAASVESDGNVARASTKISNSCQQYRRRFNPEELSVADFGGTEPIQHKPNAIKLSDLFCNPPSNSATTTLKSSSSAPYKRCQDAFKTSSSSPTLSAEERGAKLRALGNELSDLHTRMTSIEVEINRIKIERQLQCDSATLHTIHPLFADAATLPVPARVLAVLPDGITKLSQDSVAKAICFALVPHAEELTMYALQDYNAPLEHIREGHTFLTTDRNGSLQVSQDGLFAYLQRERFTMINRDNEALPPSFYSNVPPPRHTPPPSAHPRAIGSAANSAHPRAIGSASNSAHSRAIGSASNSAHSRAIGSAANSSNITAIPNTHATNSNRSSSSSSIDFANRQDYTSLINSNMIGPLINNTEKTNSSSSSSTAFNAGTKPKPVTMAPPHPYPQPKQSSVQSSTRHRSIPLATSGSTGMMPSASSIAATTSQATAQATPQASIERPGDTVELEVRRFFTKMRQTPSSKSMESKQFDFSSFSAAPPLTSTVGLKSTSAHVSAPNQPLSVHKLPGNLMGISEFLKASLPGYAAYNATSPRPGPSPNNEQFLKTYHHPHIPTFPFENPVASGSQSSESSSGISGNRRDKSVPGTHPTIPQEASQQIKPVSPQATRYQVNSELT